MKNKLINAKEDDIQLEEVLEIIKYVKRGKAAGHDEMTREFLKPLRRSWNSYTYWRIEK